MENPKSKYLMELALMQAAKVLGKTKTNPAVGCIIVKNDNVVSAASTSFNGRPHAEHNALKFIKKKNENLLLYSTLEPCAHYGKTSPCVNKIISKRIKKVYFSIKDPDIRTYNRAYKVLKKNKISVFTNIHTTKVNKFYKSYIKYKKQNLPYVTCKMATSRDYYINDNRNKYITNKFSRARGHFMRSNHDCILSTSKTVIDDNPEFTCRIPGLERFSPARVILDSSLKVPINSKFVKLGKKYKTIIFYNKIKKKKLKMLKKNNIKLIREKLNNEGLFVLKRVLLKIKKIGFSRVFLECGLKLSDNFLKERLIDDFYLFMSNKKIGSNGKNNIRKIFNTYLKYKKFNYKKVNLFGDKLIHYKI